ncbi:MULTISPECIES: sugar ABC transporter substrate-binding protein [Paenibacillus]|uniref:Rhizopine-binding protein n=1 Tax=Paenibacillus naphthalenovorans TaxID=162209 RepID=A0A0U2UNU3_9BACL|nr:MULTISPECIES: sugar ABC transporter substrate-binding protein [Paenibacillus]ALS23665.1 rhizopine-binding protein [Paenibacillus naphthalenovorans]NTZ19371.1 sugar ABC transporter substrate-binding protein [Paenibacillus sp. JMULE4]GCL73504.1 hypothetical protein PN4B1_34410 [Paenibacillus naphthalenovorans]SDJ38312.1 inositol transport system substrate-binding protein [Paenibacillus naphthalenovorans]
MNKMKALFLPMVLLAGVLSACGGGGGSASGGAGSDGNSGEKKLTIGVSYQNLQNEFAINIQNAVRDKANEKGVELLEADGQGKSENQIAQIENFINRQVDAIILNPYDKNGAAPAVDLAVAAKIPVIVVNSQVSNLDKATAFSGSDDVVAGKLQMQFIADQLGGKGNVVIIHGPNGNSAEISRTEGNKEVLTQYPDIKVLAEQTANWDRAQALNLMENWLQTHKDIDAVVAQNDEMALGAYKAIEAAKKADDILVVGIDAIPDALKSVEAGQLAATVFQDSHGQGSKAVELAIQAAKGESVEHMNYIPFQLVTKENLSEFKK